MSQDNFLERTGHEKCEALTVAGYSGESYVHLDRELLATASIYDNRCVDIDSAIVEEFEQGDREDDRRREECYCKEILLTLISLSETHKTDKD